MINRLLVDNTQLTIGSPNVLVIAPTRELAIQIFTEARKFSFHSYLKVSIIYGGTSSKHQEEVMSKGCHILIATPGRLMDFTNKGYVNYELLQFVVLDEADRMLDMGFKDDIATIMTHPTMPTGKQRPQTLMFSATFPREIQQLASQYLNDYVFVTIGVIGGACSDIKQTIYELPRYKKRNKLVVSIYFISINCFYSIVFLFSI